MRLFVLPSGESYTFWFEDAGVAPLPTRFRNGRLTLSARLLFASALAEERFFLLCHSRAPVLLTRLSVRCFPSSRPDTASFRSCLLLPPGWHLRK